MSILIVKSLPELDVAFLRLHPALRPLRVVLSTAACGVVIVPRGKASAHALLLDVLDALHWGVTLLLVQVLREKLDRQELEDFGHHHVVSGAHLEHGQVQPFGQSLHLLGADCRVLYQVYLGLNESHGDFSALVLHRAFPPLHVVETIPVRCRKCQDARRCALVVPTRQRVELFLASSVPNVKLHFLAQVLNKVLFLQEIYAQGLLVLFEEHVLDEPGDQTGLSDLKKMRVRKDIYSAVADDDDLHHEVKVFHLILNKDQNV